MRTKTPKQTARWYLVATLAVATLWGCPGRIDDVDSLVGEIDCVAYTDQLIVRSCATSGCHTNASANAAGGLSLQGNDVGSRLRDAPGSATCGGVLISTADPAQSLMYQKLLASPPCGDRMPLFDRAPQDFEIECMLEWIQAQRVGSP